MKKLCILLLTLLTVFTVTACKDSEGGSTGTSGSKHTPSTDYFWEKHDFTAEWMLPDDGVYTRYTYTDPAENEMGNEAVSVYVYDITDEQIASYIQKVEQNGYTMLMENCYTKAADGKTAMIKINRYPEDGYILIFIDPSI